NSGAAAISKLLSDHGRMTGNPDRTQLGRVYPGISSSKRPPGLDLSSTCTEQWFLAYGSDQDEFFEPTSESLEPLVGRLGAPAQCLFAHHGWDRCPVGRIG